MRLTMMRSPSPRSFTIAFNVSKTASEPFSPQQPLGLPGGRTLRHTSTCRSGLGMVRF